MIFTASPRESSAWWGSVLDLPVQSADGFYWLDLPGQVELGFHPADEAKNPLGMSTVPYWRTADLDAAMATFAAAGAIRHRGPLTIDDGRRIAQMVDPFGAVFGLDQT